MANYSAKRAVIYKHDTFSEGKLVGIPQTMGELRRLVQEKLQLSCVEGIYTAKGGRVDDIQLIRDDEILYVASEKPASNNVFFASSLLYQQTNKADDLINRSYSDWVTLNVGGQLFTTTRGTLVSKANSMLAKMFSVTDSWCSIRDPSGAYLIDRSPVYFEPILNYLRHGHVILDEGVNPRGVLEEAKFFGLTSMIEELEDTVKRMEKLEDESLSRNEFVRILLSTPSTRELRCQGINLEGADLSNLDLRHINFKMANLSHSDLAGANLSHCSLENSNLSYAHLDGAILGNTRFQRANLEGASLRGCNFEDPTGVQAHLEGVNLKASDLEGSQMTNVILRVATLKGANLQNCNLRGAILAGADLENCNLSGCDLQDANLRGANVVGAKFAEILGPLHMSQSVGACLVIGSFPKPDYLHIPDWFRLTHNGPYIQQYNGLHTNLNEKSREQFDKTLKKATTEVMKLQEEVGIDVITDGEMARESYVHYFCRKIKGIDFVKLTTKSSRNGAWVADLPTIVTDVRAMNEEPWVHVEWQESQKIVERPVKITIPGPMTIINSVYDGYYNNDRELSGRLVKIINKEIQALVAAGCQYIQVDEPVLVRFPERALEYGIDHLAACFEGVPSTVNKCVHLCCGYPTYFEQKDYQKAPLDAYLKIADKLDQAGFDYISIEDAHRTNDLNLFKHFQKSKVVLGVIKIASSKLETVQEIKDRIAQVLTVVPADRLVIAPDCGLGFLPTPLAVEKLKNMVEAAKSFA